MQMGEKFSELLEHVKTGQNYPVESSRILLQFQKAVFHAAKLVGILLPVINL